MKKQFITEARRFQKLAGIIREGASLGGKQVNLRSIEIDGIDMEDFPDFSDFFHTFHIFPTLLSHRASSSDLQGAEQGGQRATPRRARADVAHAAAAAVGVQPSRRRCSRRRPPTRLPCTARCGFVRGLWTRRSVPESAPAHSRPPQWHAPAAPSRRGPSGQSARHYAAAAPAGVRRHWARHVLDVRTEGLPAAATARVCICLGISISICCGWRRWQQQQQQ